MFDVGPSEPLYPNGPGAEDGPPITLALADTVRRMPPARQMAALGLPETGALQDRISHSPRLQRLVAEAVAARHALPMTLTLPSTAPNRLLLQGDDADLDRAVRLSAACLFANILHQTIEGKIVKQLRTCFGDAAYDAALTYPHPSKPPPGAKIGLDPGMAAMAAWLHHQDTPVVQTIMLRFDAAQRDRLRACPPGHAGMRRAFTWAAEQISGPRQ